MNYFEITNSLKSIIDWMNNYLSQTTALCRKIDKKIDIYFLSKIETGKNLLDGALNCSDAKLRKSIIVNAFTILNEAKVIYRELLKSKKSNNGIFKDLVYTLFLSRYKMASKLMQTLILLKAYLISIKCAFICEQILDINTNNRISDYEFIKSYLADLICANRTIGGIFIAINYVKICDNYEYYFDPNVKRKLSDLIRKFSNNKEYQRFVAWEFKCLEDEDLNFNLQEAYRCKKKVRAQFETCFELMIEIHDTMESNYQG